jgi:hypothetical protein
VVVMVVVVARHCARIRETYVATARTDAIVVG